MTIPIGSNSATMPIRRVGILATAVACAVLVLSACGDDGGDAPGAGGTEVSAGQTVGSVQASGAMSPAGVTLVDPAGAVKLLDAETAMTIIDVRTPSEFAAGHLAGAVNIDVDGPRFAIDIASLDKSATYFVYCHSGRRSAIATQAMSDKGFTTVYELEGGIEAWLAGGRAVVTG